MSKRERDEISGTETTGHSWDGLKELNTPLPRWWVWTFYATIIWAIGYSIVYPSWPLLTTNFKGLWGWSSRADVSRSMADAQTAQKEWVDKIAAADVDAINADENLRNFAIAGGAAAFKVNCVQCHGSGAAGAVGYPNLNDNDWLWGGKLADIYTTIQHGIRSTDDSTTRDSAMPAFADGVLDATQTDQVANYVLKISGNEADEAAATAGAQLFTDNCASCHGADGKGMRDFGAPNLTDGIWLRFDAPTKENLVAQIGKPHHGLMPAWAAKLDDATIKQLAVYVHSLGGGE
ncbi:MAG TPA: cytochrome-c oxidase, cbb3-type subunit III [Aestuariivirga sp.]|mgnify:CR=1 FL=1|nr:cytochrome-c oxidase, cbb3-type subunit III [Aestuariivirga sp.]